MGFMRLLIYELFRDTCTHGLWPVLPYSHMCP